MGRENLEDYNAVFLIQLESWEATRASKHLHHRDTDNVSIKDGHGNSLPYTLDRLKRKHPELYQRVVAASLCKPAPSKAGQTQAVGH